MWYIYAAVFLLGLVCLLKFSRRNGKGLPGPRGLPFIGNTFQYTDETMHLKLADWTQAYGPIFAISSFGTRMVVISNEDLLRKAFSTPQFRKIMNGRMSTFYGQYMFFGDQGIAFQNDLDLHAKLRKGFIKCFNNYGEGREAFESSVTIEIQRMCQRLSVFEGQDCKPSDDIRCFLSNVTSVLLFGRPINDTGIPDDLLWKFTHLDDAIMNPNISLIATIFPFLRFFPGEIKRIYDKIVVCKDRIITEFIFDIKNNRVPGETPGLVGETPGLVGETPGLVGETPGLVGAMFQSQTDDIKEGRDILFTDEQIICVAMESLAAGMLTSVSALCSLVLCMIHHQKCQGRLYREIMAVIGPHRPPSQKDRHNMPYLDAVIYETLRYASPVPMGLPHLCTENVDFEGYRINNGDLIVPNIWHIQHDEELWGDPFVFRPERFLDSDGEMVPPSHKYRRNWCPFGLGTRQCVGESIARSRLFYVVATLFQQFRFLPPTDGECTSCDPRTYNVALVINPDNFKCKLESRQKMAN